MQTCQECGKIIMPGEVHGLRISKAKGMYWDGTRWQVLPERIMYALRCYVDVDTEGLSDDSQV